jgi:hypothetical protein
MTPASTKSVRLDADVIDELKLVAARRKTTIKALIEQALYDSLRRRYRSSCPAELSPAAVADLDVDDEDVC